MTKTLIIVEFFFYWKLYEQNNLKLTKINKFYGTCSNLNLNCINLIVLFENSETNIHTNIIHGLHSVLVSYC